MWVFHLNNAKYVKVDEVRFWEIAKENKFGQQQHTTVKSVYLHASITVNYCFIEQWFPRQKLIPGVDGM